MSDIIIYTISLIMGFRIYALSNDLHFFAIEGCLPCEKTKKRNRTILKAIAIIAVVDWVMYSFLNTYWTFVARDVHAMRFFNSVNELCEVSLMILNSVLHVLAFCLVYKMQNILECDKQTE